MKRRAESILRADLAQLDAFLREIPKGRDAERIGFESRRTEILAELEQLDHLPPYAFLDVTFSGAPVVASRGIEAEFGTNALTALMGTVQAAIAADEAGFVGARGPLPGTSGKLHITEALHGSFGFRIEELGQQELLGSKVSSAVESVGRLLETVTVDDQTFAEAVGDVDPRVVASLRGFLSLLSQNKATCHVESGTHVVDFSSQQDIGLAVERIEHLVQRQVEKPFEGVLLGILPVARRFEFMRPDGEVIRGRIARVIEEPEALREWEGRRCVARLKITTLERPEQTTVSYTLLKIDES